MELLLSHHTCTTDIVMMKDVNWVTAEMIAVSRSFSCLTNLRKTKPMLENLQKSRLFMNIVNGTPHGGIKTCNRTVIVNPGRMILSTRKRLNGGTVTKINPGDIWNLLYPKINWLG